jgi:acetylornithine deacetylase/succinyl-diaminopimelate desuccinylase-like protein
MKGALAAMMVAVCQAKSTPLRGTVVLAAVAGEEGAGSVGMVEFIRTGPRSDYAVVGEPTGLDVCVSHKGSCNMLVTVVGRTAHSATPQQGLNAADGLVKAIERVSSEVKPWVESNWNPLLGHSTLSVTGIEGGGRSDSIPAFATALLNIRYVPGLMPEDLEARLRDALLPLAQDGFEIRVERRRVPRVSAGGTYELEAVPLVTDESHHLVAHASEAVRMVTGRDARIVGLPCWTDAALLSTRTGAATIVLGPGDILCAHGPREYVSIREVREAVLIYSRIIGQICLGA